MDSSGNITWQNTIGGSGEDELSSIQPMADGGYMVVGSSFSPISGDKSENSKGADDGWIYKLNSSGDILWQKTIGGDSEDYLRSFYQTNDGGFILAGESESGISGDKTEPCNGYFDYWIIKTDSSGIIQWQNDFGGNDIEYLATIQQTSDGEYFVGGRSYSSVSGDKSEPCEGGLDYWVMKLSETFNLVKGNLFIDLNSNSIQDAGEPGVSNHIVNETVTGRFSFSDPDGSYAVSVLDTGAFVVVPDPVNYYTPVPSSHSVTFLANNQLDLFNDFAFQPAGIYNDLSVVLTPLQDFNPGFDATYDISFSNWGTTTIAPKIVFYSDPNLTYVSATVTPDIITADSIVWNTTALAPFQKDSIQVTFNVNSNVVIGPVISTAVIVEPLNDDADTSNNHSEWSSVVLGSYDPNEILVNKTSLTPDELDSNPWLDYIINFQNTGTDTAINIKIVNVIPSSLDFTSFEFMAASDPVSISIDQGLNKFAFHFQDILLPDSNVNEQASHGFIHYRIKPSASLGLGDHIINNASIFFDFNQAIHTNDAITQVEIPTATGVISGSSDAIQVFPNPTSQIVTVRSSHLIPDNATLTVTDLYGREVARMQNQNGGELKVDVSLLPAGVYILHLLSNQDNEATTLIKE